MRDGTDGCASRGQNPDRPKNERKTSVDGENDWDGAYLLYKNDDKLCACTVDIAIDVCLLKLLSMSI